MIHRSPFRLVCRLCERCLLVERDSVEHAIRARSGRPTNRIISITRVPFYIDGRRAQIRITCHHAHDLTAHQQLKINPYLR